MLALTFELLVLEALRDSAGLLEKSCSADQVVLAHGDASQVEQTDALPFSIAELAKNVERFLLAGASLVGLILQQVLRRQR